MAKKRISKKDIIDTQADKIYKVAMGIYEDINRYSHDAIDQFYNDYQPRVYKRINAMPLVWQPSPFVLQADEQTYKLIFTYSQDGLSDHGNDSGNVFDGPFVQGYHGPPWGRGGRIPAPQMQPSPWDMILDYAKFVYNAKEL